MEENLPANQETQELWVRALGQEDSLEKEMATHSSIFVWKIQWTEKTGGLRSMGSQRVRHNWVYTGFIVVFFCEESYGTVSLHITRGTGPLEKIFHLRN